MHRYWILCVCVCVCVCVFLSSLLLFYGLLSEINFMMMMMMIKLNHGRIQHVVLGEVGTRLSLSFRRSQSHASSPFPPLLPFTPHFSTTAFGSSIYVLLLTVPWSSKSCLDECYKLSSGREAGPQSPNAFLCMKLQKSDGLITHIEQIL